MMLLLDRNSPQFQSIGWFKGKITGNSHISWENLWFPVDFPLGQPIDINNSPEHWAWNPTMIQGVTGTGRNVSSKPFMVPRSIFEVPDKTPKQSLLFLDSNMSCSTHESD